MVRQTITFIHEFKLQIVCLFEKGKSISFINKAEFEDNQLKTIERIGIEK